MWIPKGTTLIRGQRLFEAWWLLEEIQYSKLKQNNVDLRRNSNIPKLWNNTAKLSNTPERRNVFKTGKNDNITI